MANEAKELIRVMTMMQSIAMVVNGALAIRDLLDAGVTMPDNLKQFADDVRRLAASAEQAADEINAAAAGGAVTTEGAMDAIKAVR